jgi:hypothetical protein
MQGRRVTGRDKQPVAARVNNFEYAACRGCHDGSACHHPFHDHSSKWLRGGGGVNDDVHEVHECGNVLSEAEEVNAIGEVQGVSLVAKLGGVVRIGPKEGVAHDQSVNVGKVGEGVEKHVLALPRGQSAEHAH